MNSLFQKNKEIITIHNISTITNSSLLIIIILAALSLFSLFTNSLHTHIGLYFTFLVIFVVFFVIIKFFIPKQRIPAYISYCVFLIITFLFAIELGTRYSPNNNAATFCVLLVAIPLLIIDIPLRTDIFLTFITVIFCFCTAKYKAPNLASIDIVNAISFLVVSFFVNYFVIKTQLSEIESQKIVKWQRDRDSLTQLYNRQTAVEMIDEYIKTTSAPACLMVVDIDNFKTVNDTYGHQAGDEVIHLLCTSITSAIRSTDIVGRFGGDEFLIFLTNISDISICEKKAQSILKHFKDSAQGLPYENAISASLGIALYPKDAACYNDLFETADKSLYHAKNHGKNRFSSFSHRNTSKPTDSE